MASNKTYTVVKDGEALKELKTLAAAKRLADAEDAEVLCDGECVYQGTVDPATPAVEEAVEKVVKSATYTLLRKMNVRKEPSLTAEKVAVQNAGATVEVTAVVDDWLHLVDGSFILYEGGKNARKGNG